MLTALSLIRGLIFQFTWTRFSLRSTCLSEPYHCYCIFHCSRGSSCVRTREARPDAGDGSSMLDNVIIYCKILKQHVFGDDVTDCRPYVAQRCVGTPSPAKWTGDVPWHGSRICCALYFSTNLSCILSILTVSVRCWVSVMLKAGQYTPESVVYGVHIRLYTYMYVYWVYFRTLKRVRDVTSQPLIQNRRLRC